VLYLLWKAKEVKNIAYADVFVVKMACRREGAMVLC
jgi:hypothetical protein